MHPCHPRKRTNSIIREGGVLFNFSCLWFRIRWGGCLASCVYVGLCASDLQTKHQQHHLRLDTETAVGQRRQLGVVGVFAYLARASRALRHHFLLSTPLAGAVQRIHTAHQTRFCLLCRLFIFSAAFVRAPAWRVSPSSSSRSLSHTHAFWKPVSWAAELCGTGAAVRWRSYAGVLASKVGEGQAERRRQGRAM